jgi:hypothetical protein
MEGIFTKAPGVPPRIIPLRTRDIVAMRLDKARIFIGIKTPFMITA